MCNLFHAETKSVWQLAVSNQCEPLVSGQCVCGAFAQPGVNNAEFRQLPGFS
jgi:hypothetical protein